jgi:hypothetical protein
VSLDEPDDDVHALGLQKVGVLEHLVGLAHPRRVADVDLQLPASRLLDQLEEYVRGRAAEILRRHRRILRTRKGSVEVEVRQQDIDSRLA